MIDHSAMRLGLLPSIPTPHLPAMVNYAALLDALPAPPAIVDWSDSLDWPMLANNYCGCCAIAGPLHAIQAAERWRDGASRPPTDEQAVAGYSAIAGYDPARPETDVGCLLSDVMMHWQTVGLPAPGGVNHIRSFARITNLLHIKAALWLLGPLVIGVVLPIAAQTQPIWTTPANLTGDNAPSSWGGHCVLLVGIDADGTAKFVTWGQIKQAEPGWLAVYLDEAWAPVQPTWLGSGRTPCGVLGAAILADMP